ncbi:MAG: hypothetical protein NVS9B1_27280 [Candidatus Dormibacteraceae bacterium]
MTVADLTDPALLKNVDGGPIRRVAISEDQVAVVLELMDGQTFAARTEGDCCSSSWVEHLTVPPDIEGATIIGVARLGEHTEINSTDDCLSVYHTAIPTTAGEIVIEYRNSSNGYYGGWLNPFYRVEFP